MKGLTALVSLTLCLAAPAVGQTTMATEPDEAGDKWSFSLAALQYFVPDEQPYVQPTLIADHGWLHLEARYNYEELNTTSAWGGYNFAGGEELAWEVTPMVGGVFGDIVGVAPGYKGSLSWRKLHLYSEGEYVFDTGGNSDSFLYNWSELTYSLTDWLRLGIAGQRTRADHADHDYQPGVTIGVSFKHLDLTAYVFNPTESKPTVILGATLTF